MNTTKEIEKIIESNLVYLESRKEWVISDRSVMIYEIEQLLEQSKREVQQFTIKELKDLNYWLFTVPQAKGTNTMPIEFQDKIKSLIKEQKVQQVIDYIKRTKKRKKDNNS